MRAARAIGLAGVSDALRDRVQVCCASLGILLVAAACPHVAALNSVEQGGSGGKRSLSRGEPTARNKKRVREVRRLERELAAARPRPGSGETKRRSVWPEPRERKVFASQEPGW
jgi:hypothetical protein